MIPSEDSPVPAINFFLSPVAKPSTNNKTSAKIQIILQDAHALNKLAQSHDIAHFLNQTPNTCSAELSTMATLAENISKAMDSVVRSRSATARGRQSQSRQRHSGRIKKNTKQSFYSDFLAADDAEIEKRCQLCDVTQTPRWRYGTSSEHRLLCNVCGLVQTRRFASKLLALSGESSLKESNRL